MTDPQDFQNLWDARLLSIVVAHLEPAPKLDMIEGNAAAEFSDGATLVIAVDPLEENPPHSGFWFSEVTVQYNYQRQDDGEVVSQTWGRILEAVGDGEDGSSPLRDRLRVDPGRTVVPGGIDIIQYDRALVSDEARIKQFQFSAYLGLSRLDAPPPEVSIDPPEEP